MRQTKVPCNSQLYLEHQEIYTLRVKSHMSEVSIHKDKAQVAKPRLSMEACKPITMANVTNNNVMSNLK